MKKRTYLIIGAVIAIAAAVLLGSWVFGEPGPSVSDAAGSDEYSLALQNGEWNAEFLSPAAEVEAPEGVFMTRNKVEDGKVIVAMHNETAEDWTYGAGFSLQVKLEGTWYPVPAPTEWNTVSLAYILEAGTSVERPCNLRPWGDLPAGTYRLVKEIFQVEKPGQPNQKYLTAEFEIP